MGITQGSDGWGQFSVGTFDFPTKVTTGSQIWVRVSLYVPAVST